MSSPGITRSDLLEWLKGGGLLAITIFGLFFYAFLSVPAIVFYDRLGVSPTEVGLTYSNLLSGSTAEIIAILILLTIMFLATASLIAFLSLYVRMIRLSSEASEIRSYLKPAQELSDEDFERYMRIACGLYTDLPEFFVVRTRGGEPVSFGDQEAVIRRVRELRLLGVLSEEESAELDTLITRRKDQSLSLSGMPLRITQRWIRRRAECSPQSF